MTDCYGDLIDDVSDHNLEVDCLYCPAYDLTRIGFPDWCECPFNRALDYERCASNLPYYGPRNRTRYAYDMAAMQQYQQQQQPAVPADNAVPPAPGAEESLELPPAPAEAAAGPRMLR